MRDLAMALIAIMVLLFLFLTPYEVEKLVMKIFEVIGKQVKEYAKYVFRKIERMVGK